MENEKTMGEIELLDTGDMLKALVVVKGMQGKLKAIEAGLRESLDKVLDTHDSRDISIDETHIGKTEKRQGREPKWKVRDPEAYAELLKEHGMGEMVEKVEMPLKSATTDAFIGDLVRNEAEIPDCVELSGGTADTVVVTVDKDIEDKLSNLGLGDVAEEIFGIKKKEIDGGESWASEW